MRPTVNHCRRCVIQKLTRQIKAYSSSKWAHFIFILINFEKDRDSSWLTVGALKIKDHPTFLFPCCVVELLPILQFWEFFWLFCLNFQFLCIILNHFMFVSISFFFSEALSPKLRSWKGKLSDCSHCWMLSRFGYCIIPAGKIIEAECAHSWPVMKSKLYFPPIMQLTHHAI